MVDLYKEFCAELGQEEVEAVAIPVIEPRKVPKAVRLLRERDKTLRIIADDGVDEFT